MGMTSRRQLLNKFQSTLPIRGATRTPSMSRTTSPDFNPRSPYGERRCHNHAVCHHFLISIHAPHTGSDDIIGGAVQQTLLFQSTLPIRGATGLPAVLYRRYRDFNPRSPYGERPTWRTRQKRSIRFQSTLPIRGATQTVPGLKPISKNFNPRSPYGERHCTSVSSSSGGPFQSTLPIRGATADINKSASAILFISDKLQSSYRALTRQADHIAAIHLKKETPFRCEPLRRLMFSIASHH